MKTIRYIILQAFLSGTFLPRPPHRHDFSGRQSGPSSPGAPSQRGLSFSRVCTAFVNFLYSLAAYVVILAVFRISLGIAAFFFPLVMILLFFFLLGAGYILAVLYVVFRRYPPSLFRVSHPAYVSFRAFLSLGTVPEGMQAFIRAKSHLSVYLCRQILCYVPGDPLRRSVGENDPLEPFVLSGRNIYFPKSKD